MLRKKGESSSMGLVLSAIVVAIILVLVVFLVGRQFGLFGSTSGGISGKTNIDIIRQSCQQQCESQQEVEFCQVQKDYIDVDGKRRQAYCGGTPLNVACQALQNCNYVEPTVVTP